MGRYILAGDGTFIVERRATPRYEVAMSVRIGVTGADGDWIQGITTNLSDRGVQVLIPSPIPEGKVVDFECSLFAGTGEVVWIRDEGDQVRLGMKLVPVSGKDRRALGDLLSSLTKEYAGGFAAR